jgi:hypothetical protein
MKRPEHPRETVDSETALINTATLRHRAYQRMLTSFSGYLILSTSSKHRETAGLHEKEVFRHQLASPLSTARFFLHEEQPRNFTATPWLVQAGWVRSMAIPLVSRSDFL